MNLIQSVKNLFSKPSYPAVERDTSLSREYINATRGYLSYVEKPMFSTRKTVAVWKQAQQQYMAAEEPRAYHLEDLYTDILTDAHLTSQINLRKQQTLSNPFVLESASGKADKEQTDALGRHPLFRSLSNAMLDSIFHTGSLVELKIGKNLDGPYMYADTLPRTHVVHRRGLFYPDVNDEKAIQYRQMPEFGTWILEFNGPDTMGLLNKAVPHVLFSRFSQSCWAELCEIYGIPPRVLKTNTQDSVQLHRAEQMLIDQGAAAWFVIDKDEDFEFAQGVVTKGEVYEQLMQYCDNQKSLLINGAILGQDTKFGNRSKEESSADLQWYIVLDDMAYLEQQWNNIALPALVRHGIVKPGLSLRFEETEDIGQLWKFTEGAMKYFEVDPAFVKEKFGVAVLGPKNSTPKDADGEPDQPGNEPKKPGSLWAGGPDFFG